MKSEYRWDTIDLYKIAKVKSGKNSEMRMRAGKLSFICQPNRGFFPVAHARL